MIVGNLSDPYLRAALLRAAHAEEDVVLEYELAVEALERGAPRLVVEAADSPHYLDDLGVAVPRVRITRAMTERWEATRRARELPVGRVEGLTGELKRLVDRQAMDVTWVDRTLADLSRAAGAPLPPPLRSFGRRVLEFPSYYHDLHPLAEACGTTRGALKARFRRRGMPSPYTYLRWFRLLACGWALSDRNVTVAQAAHRFGFTSDGNLCRAMANLTGLKPTEVRESHGWNRMLLMFAWSSLSPQVLEAWMDLDDLFVRAA